MKIALFMTLVSLVSTGAFAKNVAEITTKETQLGYLARGELKVDEVVVCTLPENLIVKFSSSIFDCEEGLSSSVGIQYHVVGDDTFKNIIFTLNGSAFSANVDHWHNIKGPK